MDIRNFESILTVGENVAVEFKRCGSGIGNDVYESIFSEPVWRGFVYGSGG